MGLLEQDGNYLPAIGQGNNHGDWNDDSRSLDQQRIFPGQLLSVESLSKFCVTALTFRRQYSS
jgi:hypothetical protein